MVAVSEEDAPNDLSLEERLVWLRLAPFALAAGTLTDAWALAFCLLCRNIALERRYAGSVTDAGGASHRGLVQIIDRELLRFKLSPNGGESTEAPAAPAVDPMKEKYFGGSRPGA